MDPVGVTAIQPLAPSVTTTLVCRCAARFAASSAADPLLKGAREASSISLGIMTSIYDHKLSEMALNGAGLSTTLTPASAAIFAAYSTHWIGTSNCNNN